jgi:DNA-binding beta-propeller fold protein YncE
MKVSHFSTQLRLKKFITVIAATTIIATVAIAQTSEFVGPPDELQVNAESIIREGVSVDFKVTPSNPAIENLMEGEFADIEFRIEGAEDGEPLQGVYPGVWIDLTQTPDGQEKGTTFECRTRVGQYLQGLVGMRPLIDLNSYYVMVLNQDASISVIDPVVGITGITSLYANIPLTRPGADWAKTSDEKTMFVSMPRANQLAIVDLDTFKVTRNIDAGDMPMRTVLQPDEKYLWIGNDAAKSEVGGVTVIETATGDIVASIETGKGHHEISFSTDNRTAFVTNRESGTISLIDIETLEKMLDIDSGPTPISLSYSPLSDSLYVADGSTGQVMVISADSGEPVGTIETSPGLGPMSFSEDGRWGILVNPQLNMVYVIDAATNDIAHTIPMDSRPFHVSVTRTFAYVRRLDSERVAMINLQELDRGGQVIINEFAAGTFPPGQVSDISIADGMVPAAQDAAVLVVSPGDATVYYYMEGMNAPMGAFRNYGHKPRAVQIANRALKESEPGVYTATVKLPVAGTFEIAFLNETPQFLHCFTMEAAVNPAIKPEFAPVAIEYLTDQRAVAAGDNITLRFRLIDPGTGEVFEDKSDVRVKYFRAPRFNLTEMSAIHVGGGVYEAKLTLDSAGAYYVYVSAPSLNAQFDDLDYITLMASRAAAANAGKGEE